jgi:hypothetical protein
MEPPILAEIWIYPIKSLGGIRVASSRVMPKGLAWDRRWMLIDETGKFLTQRTHPKLSAFKLRPLDGGFRITHREHSMDLMHGRPSEGPAINATVWDDEVLVQEVSGEWSKWFTDHAGFPCRLVSFAEESPRPVDTRYQVRNDHVSLADGYPILLIGMESLNDLNQRLPAPVPMNRFRPNLIFTGGTAYEEDNWRTFTIGNNRLVGVKPCSRCVFTTIDQHTGQMGIEPLATLAQYRKVDGKVNFGQNVIPLDCDTIYEGDEIKHE